MKKNLIPGLIIIASLSSFSGCTWFNKWFKNDKKESQKKATAEKLNLIDEKPLRAATLKELEQKFLQINRTLEAKMALKKKDADLINLQKSIETKAQVANAKIKKMVQGDETLKQINDQIVVKRQQLNDKTIEATMRQQLQKETVELIAQFKNNDQYKTDIEPLEFEVKQLSQRYNTINLAYNTKIKALIDKKDEVMKAIKEKKK